MRIGPLLRAFLIEIKTGFVAAIAPADPAIDFKLPYCILNTTPTWKLVMSKPASALKPNVGEIK
jgi:hypothetical protein